MTRPLVRTLLGCAAALLAAAAPGQEPDLATGDIHFDTLTASTIPFHASSASPVRLIVRGVEDEVIFNCPFYGWNAPTVSGRTITFELTSWGCPSASSIAGAVGSPVERTWELGFLAAGVYDVVFSSESIAPGPVAQDRIEVFPPSGTLRLRGDFTVTVERPTAGPLSSVQAVALSEESGYFTFFTPSNVELTIKILDGRGINGHYWVFIASMTDQPFVITVLQNRDDCLLLPTDPKLSCPWRSYTGIAGQNGNVIDLAFPLEAPSP